MGHVSESSESVPGRGDEGNAGKTRSTGHHVLVLTLLVLLVELTGLTYTMVTPALTGIGKTFRATDGAWVITAVTLVGALAYAVFGKLGDIFGKKRMALAVTMIFAVGAVLSAIAPTFGVLVAGRALQGAGLVTLAMVYGLIRDLFPKKMIPVALGFVGAGFGASPIIGPVVGGYLIDAYTFRGVFWFLAAYSLVIAILVLMLVPESPVRARVRMDWIGVLLLGAGALVLLLGIGNAGTAGWGDARTLIGVVAGVLLLVAWFGYERRPAQPLIDPELLKRRRVAATLTTSFFVQFALVGNALLVPLFVMTPRGHGYGFGSTALGAAKFAAVAGITGVVAGPLAGALARRIGPRVTLAIGTAAIAAGAVLMALFHTTGGEVIAGQAVFGVGIGACSASMSNMIVQSVPAHVQGISGGMLNLTGSLGSSIGSQVLVVILLIPAATTAAGGQVVYGELGFTVAYLTLGLTGALGLLAMWMAGRETRTAVADGVHQGAE